MPYENENAAKYSLVKFLTDLHSRVQNLERENKALRKELEQIGQYVDRFDMTFGERMANATRQTAVQVPASEMARMAEMAEAEAAKLKRVLGE